MAITRTQIAKQLLANGGRTGFFSAGLARGDDISPGTSTSGGDRRGQGRPNMRDIAGPIRPVTNPVFGDPDPEVDVPTRLRKDTGTNFLKNLNAERRANPFLTGASLINPIFGLPTLFKVAKQTGNMRKALGMQSPTPVDSSGMGGGGDTPLWAQLGYSSEAEYLAALARASGETEQVVEGDSTEEKLFDDDRFRRFRANGGRIGFFKGAQADASAGKGAMSPGTDTGGGFRGGGDDGPKGPTGGNQKPPVVVNLKKGLTQHNINNQKLKDAVALGLITNDEYNILGGYDVSQTMGMGPVDTALASGAYNLFQSALGPKLNPNPQPFSEVFGDVKRNVQGASGLSEDLKAKYDNIMSMSSSDLVAQKADQKVAQMAEGGIMNPDIIGGEMDFESARQMYGLGKLVKKVTRTVKKIAKSPIGKAALAFGAFKFGPQLLTGKGLGLGNIKKFSDLKFFGEAANVNPMRLAGLASIAPLLFGTGEEEEEDQTTDRGPGLDIANIRANPYTFIPRRFAAEGGDIEPVAKKTMPLLDMGGKEMDFREDGGFVPIGRMERADDVPARLSKNEFVFTADAVRNAGDGDIDKGAEVMYNMMKNLESGGDVSEESQGLEGARRMFQTSQRLEEVL